MPTIMLVDDDEDIRFILGMMLEKEGYNVVKVENGEECLKNFEAVRPDLILLDITMPRIDGWEVCRQIKEMMTTIPIPISMLSARKTEEDIKKSLEYAHADAHIKKPIDKNELLNTIKILLEEEA
jgi:CheY-like chemotaxis protein